MALTQPRAIFGVDTVTFWNRTTALPYVTFKVDATAAMSSTIETIELRGGSLRDAWQTEPGKRTNELKITVREYGSGMWEPLTGSVATVNAAEPNGFVSPIVDQYGTSVVGSTGIASVAVDSGFEANLINSYYVVKAVSATTVDVFATTAPGVWYANDLLKINAAPLTITAGGTISILNNVGTKIGVSITGGAGVIGMTTGDTAIFFTRKINTGSYIADIGSSTLAFTDFGVDILGTDQSNGRNCLVRVYKVSAPGASINFNELAFSDNELTAMASFDATADRVYRTMYIG